jgi:hypothetical protein
MSFGGFVYYGKIACPRGHTTVVPRQTPLEIFQGQPNQPKGTPQATFLCIECGVQFPCTPEDFPLYPFERQAPNRPHPVLWHIAGECVHEDCGQLKPIFFGYDASGKEGDLRKRVFGFVKEMECWKSHRPQYVSDLESERSWVSVLPIAFEDD